MPVSQLCDLHIYFVWYLFDNPRLGLQLVMTLGMPSWSLIPGTTEDLSTSVGFEVKNKSSMLFILVGSRTTCSSPKSFAISINCFD